MCLVQPFLDLDEPFPDDFAGFPAIHPNIPPFTGSDVRLLFEEDFDVL
jgi:hypothetical protein